MKHKIYCACKPFQLGALSDYMVFALADTGIFLAHHLSSTIEWARRDIGLDGTTSKHELYDEHFGPGKWELEWVDDVTTHQGWLGALDLNKSN